MTMVGVASVIGDNGGGGSPRDLLNAKSGIQKRKRFDEGAGRSSAHGKGGKRRKRKPLNVRPLNEIEIQGRKSDTGGSCRCLRMSGLEITENRGEEEGVAFIQDVGGPSILYEKNVEET